MYTQFFKLNQSPFSIAPDPRYLFMSERHREALAHLLYGVGSGGGFVLLTGEIGAGKTTVCRCFMEQIPENCKLAYIFNPKLSVEELLLSICGEFGIDLPPQGAGAVSVKAYVDAINRYLLASHAQGKNNVLVIDEAQNLSAEVLEQLRLLTNLETSERKLLQIILIGQPELRTMLARPELEQLAQRVIARYHLGSLTVDETGSYIAHRLAVAGAAGVAPFPRSLMQQIHKLAKGVPRRINLLCDRALLGAYVENAQQVTRTIVRKAAAEVFALDDQAPAARRPWPTIAASVLAGAAIATIAVSQFPRHTVVSGTDMDTSSAAAKPAAQPTVVSGTDMDTGSAATKPAAPATVVSGTDMDTGSAAAKPAAPATVVSGTDMDTSPAVDLGAAEGSDYALRQLAQLWGLALPAGEGCAGAARRNLRCLQGKGGLADLRVLDRPAMLKLNDDPVAPRYAVLTALDAHGATLLLGGKPQTLTAQALEARFDGEFITLRRAPHTWRDAVSAGDRGPDVDWLAARLAQLAGVAKPAGNRPLDATMQRLLREFQVAQQLKADGVAGPKTFIRLSQLGGIEEPRLLTTAPAQAAVAGK